MIESFIEPPLISVPADLPVKESSGLSFLWEVTNLTRFFTSSSSLGETTTCGFTSKSEAS